MGIKDWAQSPIPIHEKDKMINENISYYKIKLIKNKNEKSS